MVKNCGFTQYPKLTEKQSHTSDLCVLSFLTQNPILLISNYAGLAVFSVRKYMAKVNRCGTRGDTFNSLWGKTLLEQKANYVKNPQKVSNFNVTVSGFSVIVLI